MPTKIISKNTVLYIMYSTFEVTSIRGSEIKLNSMFTYKIVNIVNYLINGTLSIYGGNHSNV